jgi:hypothetical protein
MLTKQFAQIGLAAVSVISFYPSYISGFGSVRLTKPRRMFW